MLDRGGKEEGEGCSANLLPSLIIEHNNKKSRRAGPSPARC